MCQVSWCNEETEFYNKSQRYKFCSTHSKYKEWVRNAPSRPWLMYKLEKILNREGTICEKCGDDLQKRFPDRALKDVIQGMDVDHINPKIKGTLKGEQPSNYQLVCKYCHLFKSIDEGDFINKKYKNG
tara:strand:+ start:514 stop:897 length:384 start_codon:yes stop_codon:yes gene_type:complete